MKYTLQSLALASVASARVLHPRDSSCCFGINVSGDGVGGSLGQISDGQNRFGPGQSGASYCINNGQITDKSGRGCVITGPTNQFQCDQGASPTGGFSLSGSGQLNFNGNGSFYACPSDDNGNYNIYTKPVANMPKCVSVGLSSANGTCAAPSSSSSAAPSSSPAAPVSVSVSSASCQPSTVVSTLTAKTVTQYITQQNNVTVPVTQYKTQISESTDTAYQTQTAYQTETEKETSVKPVPTTQYETQTQYQTVNLTKTVPTTIYKTQEETTTNYKTQEETTTAYQTEYLTTTQQSPPQTVTVTQSASPVTTTITQSASPVTVTVTQSASPVTEQVSVTQQVTTSVQAPPVTEETTLVQTASVTDETTLVQTASVTESVTSPVTQEVTTSVQAPPVTEKTTASVTESVTSVQSSPVTQQVTTTASATPSTQKASASVTPSSNSSSCPRDLPAKGDYQIPHLIVPVNENAPDTAYGTQYNAYIGSGNSTIFNFDIPQNYSGKTCEVIFTLPTQSQLETSFVSESGSGGIDFKQLSDVASKSTSFNNAPGVAQDFGVKNVTAGNAYSITSGECQAGKTLSYELTATGNKQISFFQDWNPCPIGLWVVAN